MDILVRVQPQRQYDDLEEELTIPVGVEINIQKILTNIECQNDGIYMGTFWHDGRSKVRHPNRRKTSPLCAERLLPRQKFDNHHGNYKATPFIQNNKRGYRRVFKVRAVSTD